MLFVYFGFDQHATASGRMPNFWDSANSSVWGIIIVSNLIVVIYANAISVLFSMLVALGLILMILIWAAIGNNENSEYGFNTFKVSFGSLYQWLSVILGVIVCLSTDIIFNRI